MEGGRMELFEGVIDDERGFVMGGDWPFFHSA